MSEPSPTAIVTSRRKWQRGVFLAVAVLLISFPRYSCGQETATLSVDEAETTTTETAADADIVDECTTVAGDVDDSLADLADLVDDLDTQEVEPPVGAVDDVDDKSTEEAVETEAPDAPIEETTDAATVASTSDEVADGATAAETAAAASSEAEAAEDEAPAPVVQSGPFIDILGESLLSLEMVDETHAQVHQHYTNEALSGKKVVGLYFSADWCGPCRQFTPDLVNFYNKMNSRRGKQDEFEIVWISRCRTVDDFGQYFTQMNWLALPPNEAMGQRGQVLGEKYKVKSIPTLVLLDEIGNVITTDGRNKIPMDKAGIGFPWRSPLSVLISTLVPRSFRLLVKTQLAGVLGLVKGIILGKKGA